MALLFGGVPERPKGTGCKPVGSAYGGSNPPAPMFLARPLRWCRLASLACTGAVLSAREGAAPAMSVAARWAFQCRMLTALATTITARVRLIADWTSMSIFAQRLSGIASVGLNAVALVKET
jgi:hypothetical protein